MLPRGGAVKLVFEDCRVHQVEGSARMRRGKELQGHRCADTSRNGCAGHRVSNSAGAEQDVPSRGI